MPECIEGAFSLLGEGALEDGIAAGAARPEANSEIDMSLADGFQFAGAHCERIVAGVLEKISGTADIGPYRPKS